MNLHKSLLEVVESFEVSFNTMTDMTLHNKHLLYRHECFTGKYTDS